jgi:hypothetical protein
MCCTRMNTAWNGIWKIYQNQFNIKPVAYSYILPVRIKTYEKNTRVFPVN